MFTEEQKLAALGMQHTIILVDQILRLSSDGQQLQLSLSWKVPSGQLSAPVTLVMTKDFAVELSEKLHEKITPPVTEKPKGR